MTDLLLAGGPVWTGDAARSRATAVLVRDGVVAAVGGDEVREQARAGAEVVDLGGRLLVPGFTDAHVHPVWGGLELRSCSLSGLSGAAAYVEAVGAYAAAHPERAWVLGGGWALDAFPGGLPHRDLLDAVVPDRPVYLPARDGHVAWANSRALEVAGVDARTPDPAGGRVERDPDGTPTGVLHEQAMALVGDAAPPVTPEQVVDALLLAQSHLHALGITGWQDAIVGTYAGWPDPLEAYLAAGAAGTLTARVEGALWWDRTRGLEQVDDLLARRERGRAGRFRAGTVKVMQDGVPENRTAAMSSPYLDVCGCTGGGTGLSMVDPALLREAVARLAGHGFALHFHAIGDRAVTEVLDAVEAAPRGGRHHVAHLQVVRPDDLPRFRALGVTANLQMLWAAHEPQMDELCVPLLGPERAAWQYPFADLLRSGAPLAAGSDWPVSSADPLAAIAVGVTRRLPDAPEGTPVFLPEQRLDLGTALAAYTAGSAHVCRSPGGSVVVGAPADLAVLDRDPFAGPADEIASTRVLSTFVQGERVHPSPQL